MAFFRYSFSRTEKKSLGGKLCKIKSQKLVVSLMFSYKRLGITISLLTRVEKQRDKYSVALTHFLVVTLPQMKTIQTLTSQLLTVLNVA